MSAPFGYVYYLINSTFPDCVKVGVTTKHPAERTKELSSSSGVPTPFILVYHKYVADPFKVEALIHRGLGVFRVNESREFFRVELYKIIELIDRFQEVSVRLSDTPYADLFVTFPDDGEGRELTEEEQDKCRHLEDRLKRCPL